MTDRARPVITLFRKTDTAEVVRRPVVNVPRAGAVRRIPITTVSRKAVEALVARLSKSMKGDA